MSRIFLIDDDPVFQRVITLALEAAGHSVLRCENGKKAIDYLKYERADLLITDIIMPEMDGMETVRAAKQLQPELPILAISGGGGLGPADYLGIVRTFGATEIMAKPFRPAELIEAVTRLLAGC